MVNAKYMEVQYIMKALALIIMEALVLVIMEALVLFTMVTLVLGMVEAKYMEAE